MMFYVLKNAKYSINIKKKYLFYIYYLLTFVTN